MKKIVFFFLFLCSFSACFSQDKATPKPGEGLYSFLRRNDRSVNDTDEFIRLNKNKLGKNNTLKAGVTYTLPPKTSSKKPSSGNISSNNNTKGKKREPLFGPKYASYNVESNRLKGAVFFLSSGHGGPDPGAIGKSGGKELHEDEYAYDITLRLARCLMMEGATVHMIIQDPKDGIRDDKYLQNSKRETCMGKPIPLNQVKRLKQRVDKINELSVKSKAKYQRAVFIHLDSRSKRKQLDVFFFHAEKSKDGKKLGNTMKETFRDHYKKHQPNRGFTGTVSARNLYVLKNSRPVGIFAELGNIQNEFDQRRFLLDSNRQALANWMCRAFIKDYENHKKKK